MALDPPYAEPMHRLGRRTLLVALLLALALSLATAGLARAFLWAGGYHATPEELALHNLQVDLLSNPWHHQVPASAKAVRIALPGLYNGGIFGLSLDSGPDLAPPGLLSALLLLALWRQPPARRGGIPLWFPAPPELPPKPLS